MPPMPSVTVLLHNKSPVVPPRLSVTVLLHNKSPVMPPRPSVTVLLHNKSPVMPPRLSVTDTGCASPPGLQGNEGRVYEFIVRHFLACVSQDAVGQETVVDIDIAHERFSASGLMIIARNYLDVYPYDRWSTKVGGAPRWAGHRGGRGTEVGGAVVIKGQRPPSLSGRGRGSTQTRPLPPGVVFTLL